MDLPGIYSLSPYTLEEVISRDYLIKENPDVILNVVDASNIERNLYLTTQLIETGTPVVIALNMIDVVRKTKGQINIGKLESMLSVPVIETAATAGEGTTQVVQRAIESVGSSPQLSAMRWFSPTIESSLSKIESLIENQVPKMQLRWYAIKAFERDEIVLNTLLLTDQRREDILTIITETEKELGDDSVSIITNERYGFIQKIIDASVIIDRSQLSPSDKIDRFVTNRWLGLPIFAAVMFLVYYLSISTIGTAMTDWVNDVLFGEVIPPALENFMASIGTADWMQSLVLDGIVGGIGAVLGFLPQMVVLFLCLAILEDCGYMARIAFIMDRVFRKFGLSGKSFIPILIGTGCSVPAIMATRTIENERDRKMTAIITSFMPCSAKLPIIALIAGALFGGVWWVGPSAYFVGILAIILTGIILKKTRLFAGDPAPFVMELPAYHLPYLKNVLMQTWERTRAFIRKAGSIIFIACGLIWFLSSFNLKFEMVDANESILAGIGNLAAPLFQPLGWGFWQAVVAAVTGLVAKENVVGTFGILYGFAEVAEDGQEVWSALQGAFTTLSAYSFLLFNLLCAPCFAAIGAIRREMGNAKWSWFAVGFQTILAYAASFVFYQFGTFFLNRTFTFSTGAAVVVFIFFLIMLFRSEKYQDEHMQNQIQPNSAFRRSH